MRERRLPRSRRLTAEELALWRAAMRDTRPLGETPVREAQPERAPAAEAAADTPEPPAVSPRPVAGAARRLDPRHPVGLDRRSWQRLRRGLLPIDGRLDLHGMTQEEAWRALVAFTSRMQARGARCILVITGRGLRTGGTLRQMTPRWLESPPLRERVLSYAPARIEHGGEGALYVLLRRRR